MVQRSRLLILLAAVVATVLIASYQTSPRYAAPPPPPPPPPPGASDERIEVHLSEREEDIIRLTNVHQLFRKFVSAENLKYLRRYCLGEESQTHQQRRGECQIDGGGGFVGLIVTIDKKDVHDGETLVVTRGTSTSQSIEGPLLQFNASSIAVIANETFVSLPAPLVLADIRSLTSSTLREDVKMFVRISPTRVEIDRSSFLRVPQREWDRLIKTKELTDLLPSTILVPANRLDADLRAQYDEEHDCGAPPPGAYASPRVALHIVLFWRTRASAEKKLTYLRRMRKNAASYRMQTDLYIHCNQYPHDSSSFNSSGVGEGEAVRARVLQELSPSTSEGPRVMIVRHKLHEHPYFLTWKPRALMRNQRHMYDLVINSEDDMDITRANLVEYFCRFKLDAARLGLNLGFLRYEVGVVGKGSAAKGGPRKILSDVLRGQIVGRSRDIFVMSNQSFARIRIQVYFAFWIADRRDMTEMAEHPDFMIRDTSNSKYPLIREDASCLKGPMMLPRYNYSHVMPVNVRSMFIHDMCQVWHMSNSYVGKGMARFDAAARVV